MQSKSTETPAQWLNRIEFFSQLPAPVLEEVARHALIRTLEHGQSLFSEGTEARCVYIVAHGSLKSVINDIDGREQVLSVERKGSLLAAGEIFSPGNYRTSTVAAERCVVLRIETKEATRLCRTHPQLLWKVALVLSRRVEEYGELAAMLSLRNVDQRLALHLLTITQDRAVQSDEGCVFELASTRMEIATRLGSVREVVSRSFTRLQERGLIRVRGRLVTVPDPSALQHFATHGEMQQPNTAGRPRDLSHGSAAQGLNRMSTGGNTKER